VKIFWSWQHDTPGKIGRFLIRDALQEAIDQLKQAPDIEEPTRESLHLDHDIQNVTGSPDLTRTIFSKIDVSAVVIADVTLIGHVVATDDVNKKLINSNVAIELGYALHARTDHNVLLVFNQHYGKHEDLPFDLRHKGGAVVFNLRPDAGRQEIEEEKKKLKIQFVGKLKPFVTQRPAQPEETDQLVTKLKAMIAQPSHPLLLNDLVMPIANEARATIEASEILNFAPRPSKEELVGRVRTADQATNKLAHLLAAGCRWADTEQAKIFGRALLRVAIVPSPKGAFYQDWENVARYPVLRVMYAGGVAAYSNDSFGVLRQLLVEPKLRTRPNEPEASLVTILHYGAGFMQDHWKWLPGMKRHYVPISEHLEASLRPAYREFANDDETVSRDFDGFEFFQALIYGDLSGSQSAMGFWAPLGSFIWRRRGIFEQVRADIEKSGTAWKPLQAGLFSGSPERANEIVNKLEEHTDRVRRQLGMG
jgi:hypothetical protein